MSRLIDADAFIASLKEYIDNPMTAGLCATLVELFPTAYDVEKVVTELEEMEAHYAECCLCDFNDGARVATLEALGIVRKGGIE